MKLKNLEMMKKILKDEREKTWNPTKKTIENINRKSDETIITTSMYFLRNTIITNPNLLEDELRKTLENFLIAVLEEKQNLDEKVNILSKKKEKEILDFLIEKIKKTEIKKISSLYRFFGREKLKNETERLKFLLNEIKVEKYIFISKKELNELWEDSKDILIMILENIKKDEIDKEGIKKKIKKYLLNYINLFSENELLNMMYCSKDIFGEKESKEIFNSNKFVYKTIDNFLKGEMDRERIQLKKVNNYLHLFSEIELEEYFKLFLKTMDDHVSKMENGRTKKYFIKVLKNIETNINLVQSKFMEYGMKKIY